jgi:hypothetical protein
MAVKRLKPIRKAPLIAKSDVDRIRSGHKTVTVACKLPNGLVLRLFDWKEHDEPILGGGARRVKAAHPRPETVTVNGNAAPMNGQPQSYTIIDAHRRGDGFGLTHNVDAEFFAEWLEQNKDAPYVKEGLIYAYADMGDVASKSRELEKVKSGLEPLDPDGDARAPRQIQPGTRDAKAAA